MTHLNTKIEVNISYPFEYREYIVKYTMLLFDTILNRYYDHFKLENLVKIVITENYSDDVKEFQRICGYAEYSTKSNYSIAIGQMIHYYQHGTQKYVIFFDKDILRPYFNQLVIRESKENNESILKEYNSFVHLVLHELSHINELETYVSSGFNYMTENKHQSFFNSLAYVVWQEYYATRKAAEINKVDNYYEGNLSIFKEVEDDMTKSKVEFKNHLLSYRDTLYRIEFGIRSILIYLSYYFGLCFADKAFDVNQIPVRTLFLKELVTFPVINELGRVLDNTYQSFLINSKPAGLNDLSMLIEKCFDLFDC